MRSSSPPIVPVGFDYAAAVLKINQKWSYQRIAEYIGYSERSSVMRLLDGHPPAHPQGEALWVLYLYLFKEKPPLSESQRTGSFQKVAITQRSAGEPAA